MKDEKVAVVCDKCGKNIDDLVKLGYTAKHNFPKTCADCLFPGSTLASWEDLAFLKEIGCKVSYIYLYGQYNRKPHLYGPHRIHNIEKRELYNPSVDRTFPNCKDGMVIPDRYKGILDVYHAMENPDPEKWTEVLYWGELVDKHTKDPRVWYGPYPKDVAEAVAKFKLSQLSQERQERFMVNLRKDVVE